MKLSLDDLDHKILQILEEDGRAPAKFIAEKLSVNEVTVSKRLTKIRNQQTGMDKSLIKKY